MNNANEHNADAPEGMDPVCESGTLTGEDCSGRADTTVRVVAAQYRASHQAAGYAGIQPAWGRAAGVVTLDVCEACAEVLAESEGDWCAMTHTTETALTTTATRPTPILRLARITHGDPGPCACCDEPAVSWYRTEIISDGRITVAARYCAKHDPNTHPGAAQRLCELTVADVARLSPRRAKRAAAQIARLDARADAHGRASASLAGASSMTHTHGLMGGVMRDRADTLRRLAAITGVGS